MKRGAWAESGSVNEAAQETARHKRSTSAATRLNPRMAANDAAIIPKTQRSPTAPPICPANHGSVFPPASATVKRIPNTVPECDLNRAPAIPSAVGKMPASDHPLRTIANADTPAEGATAARTAPAHAPKEQNSRIR